MSLENFIKTFYNKFKIGDDLNFDLEDKKVAKYLDITVDILRDRLSNRNTKNKLYIENVDFVKIKGAYIHILKIKNVLNHLS